MFDLYVRLKGVSNVFKGGFKIEYKIEYKIEVLELNL